jgi:protein-tyrosine kinase
MAQIIRSDSSLGPLEPRGPAGLEGRAKAFEALGPLSGVLSLEHAPEETPGTVGPIVAAAVVSGTEACEQFRILRTRVQRIGEQRPLRCIGITSATPGEGKTFTALGLAHALGRLPDSRVLLIEADLRRPSLERYLSIPRATGLSDWLREGRGPCPLRRVARAGFWLLSAGQPSADGLELLGMERVAELVLAARRLFDFTIVDCPPLAPVADAVILQDLLDGYLLVVRARHAPRETLLRAVSHLKADRIQGVVFNDHREIVSSYHRYGYQPAISMDKK